MMSPRQLCQAVNVLHISLLDTAVCPKNIQSNIDAAKASRIKFVTVCFYFVTLGTKYRLAAPALENPHPIHFS